MTKWEIDELNKQSEVRDFLKEHHMSAWDLAKITKELCCFG